MLKYRERNAMCLYSYYKELLKGDAKKKGKKDIENVQRFDHLCPVELRKWETFGDNSKDAF